MKQSFRFRRLLLLPVFLLLAGGLSADVVELKTGEKIECKILSENETSIKIEYILIKGSKIKDIKDILKTDIKPVVKYTPAQVEMEEKGLAKIVPTPDLLSASDYESIIQDRLRTFVARFPGTPEAAEVEKIIATLVEEKTKVLAGQLKVKGKWLDADTVKKEKYNIDAYRVHLAMKQKLTELPEDPLLLKEAKALREFEDMRTRFPASMEYLETIKEAQDILEAYDKRLIAISNEHAFFKKQREDGLKALPPGPEKQRIEAGIAEEVKKFKAEIEAQSKAKTKWRSVYKYDLQSITLARTAVAKERAELSNINLTSFENEIKSLNEAIGHINNQNADQAEAVMGQLRPNKNTLVNKKVFDEWDRKLKELQSKIAAEKKAAKTVAGSTAPTPGSDTPSDSANPYADALTKGKDDKGKDGKKEKATAKTTSGSTPSTGTPSTSKPPVDSEEELTTLQKINKYIPFIGGGLLVILIIAMVMGKKKKDDDE
jgi:hypothetical protein